MIRVQIKGARELARSFGDSTFLDRALRPGFTKTALPLKREQKINN